MKRLVAVVVTLAVCAAGVVSPRATAVDTVPGDHDERTAIVVYHPDGSWTGSSNAHEPRPALSLSKLYLGYWVLLNGTAEEKGKVLRMTRNSSDAVAVELDEAHPDAIDEVAELFELGDTDSDGYWGRTTTSAYDLARFVEAIKDDPVAEPLLRGMANHAPFAEDGFKQDFGTDQLPGVIGSKFGWTDDGLTAFGSVSFGEDFVVAAMTIGNVDEHTDDVHRRIDVGKLSGMPTSDFDPREHGLIDGTEFLNPHPFHRNRHEDDEGELTLNLEILDELANSSD